MKEDKSYGVVAVHDNRFLILRQNRGHWGFPKGHKEGNETDEESALRELEEESGIRDCVLLNLPPVSEEYNLVDEDKSDWHKTVKYFIGEVKNSEVAIEKDEIMDYKWATFDEAMETLTYQNTKEVLKKAHEYLTSNL